MAVVITNNLTLVDDASSTTGWTLSSNKFGAVDASNRQGTGVNCIGYQAAANEFNSFYHTITAVDMSGGYTIFAPWMRTGGPGTFAQGGFCVLIGDGTDRIAYHVGGITDFGSTERGWSRFRLDTKILPTTFTVVDGVEANLTLSSIEDIGGAIYSTPAPSGQAYNNWFDIVRYIANGSAALTIGGGTTGDRGNFGEIVTADAAVTDAWGVIFSKVAGGKVYEVLFGLEIGNSGTADSYFEDSDFQLFLNGTDMTAGNLDIDLLANSTGTNLFIIDSFQITSVGTASNWDLSSANLDTMEVTNGSFTDMGTFDFPPSGVNRKLNDCSFLNCGAITFQSSFDAKRNTFDNCGQVTAAGAQLDNCVFLNYEGTADTGALNWDVNSDPDGELDGCSFTKGTAATHAIEFGNTIPSEITLRNIDFSGYNASNSQNDSTLYFADTSGTITVNLVGCTGNISYKSAGATISLVQDPVTITFSGIIDGSELTIIKRGTADDTGSDGSTTSGSRNFVTTNSWTTDEHKGKLLYITSGSDQGRYYVSGNSATTLYLDTEMTTTASSLTWELYDENNDTEEHHVENTSGDENWQYSSGAGESVDILIINNDYQQYVILDYTKPSSSSTVPISQILDNIYFNPV